MFGRIEAAMKPMDFGGDPVQPFCRPLDLGNARQEGQHIAFLFGDRTADGGGHLILDPRLGAAPDMFEREWMAAPFAFDYRCVHQRPEPLPVKRRGHGDEAQIRPKRRLGIERQCQPEIAVETAFMHFVEEHSRNARQFGIGLDAVAENPFGEDKDSGPGGLFCIHPRGVTNRSAHRLARQLRHPLGGGAGGKAAGGEEENLSGAPRLGQQGRCHSRRLTGTRRGNQDGVGLCPEARQKHRQDCVDGKRISLPACGRGAISQYARAMANSTVSISALFAAPGANGPSASIARWP